MSSDEFAAVVAEIKRQMVEGGQDENVLQVDDAYRKIRLPLSGDRWMGVEFEHIPMPAGPDAARLFAESVLRAYRDGDGWSS